MIKLNKKNLRKLAIIFSVAFLGIFLILVLLTRQSFLHSNTDSINLLNLKDSDSLQLKFKDQTINLEVARSESKREQGLMNRTSLKENSGMIFIFDSLTSQTFWMKDTLISLDMIYLDQDLKVVNLYRSTMANQTQTVYPSNFPVQYVIEMQGGWSAKNNLQIGDIFVQ